MRRETLLERLDRLIRAGPWAYGRPEPDPPPAGPGGVNPLRPPGAPAAVVDETVQVLRKLGMPTVDAKRRATAAGAAGDANSTVQDLINAVFKQP